ncbi:PhzF family phenazine biosynthesis protein [Corynebacterium sp. 22KM0430]|uniref:PhzF family phenazine biosynthesis protein n=1 Tax=unclassified Corynebacterium TaxID=2624378 RepID=UPI0039AFB61C
MRPFAQVDVFSRHPYSGNPVAVILDAQGLSEDRMRAIARWTNLSETTFVLPPTTPEADYRLRIFTPTQELPFAGHPTLGSARAWAQLRGVDKPRLVQECAGGLIPVRREGEVFSFAAPPTLRSGPLEPEYVERIARAFRLDPAEIVEHQWVDNGPGWAVVRLESAQAVLDLEPDFSVIPEAKVGAIGPYPAGAEHAFEIRAFAPGVGVPEDPVCGSLNASTAQWLLREGLAPQRYTVSQGARVHRRGEISIRQEGSRVWVGGATSIGFQGTAHI